MKSKTSKKPTRRDQLPDDPQERSRVLDELDAAKPPAVKAREWARDARFNRKQAERLVAELPKDPLSDEWLAPAILALTYLSDSISDALTGRGLLGRDVPQHLRAEIHRDAERLLR